MDEQEQEQDEEMEDVDQELLAHEDSEEEDEDAEGEEDEEDMDDHPPPPIIKQNHPPGQSKPNVTVTAPDEGAMKSVEDKEMDDDEDEEPPPPAALSAISAEPSTSSAHSEALRPAMRETSETHFAVECAAADVEEKSRFSRMLIALS